MRRHSGPIAAVLLIVLVVLVAVVGAALDRRFGWTEFGAYRHPVSGEVLWGKTLWDWLDLLLVPAVLAIGGLLFTSAERRAEQRIADERAKTEREIAADHRQEAILQGYLDKITELLEGGLRKSDPDSEQRKIARARTLTALRALDGERKGMLLRFLHELALIQGDVTMNLYWADLSKVYLPEADLFEARLPRANLSEASLLWGDMHAVNLEWANLQGATLLGTSLRGAILENAELDENTTLPDGTKWTTDTDMARFTDPNHPDFWQPEWARSRER